MALPADTLQERQTQQRLLPGLLDEGWTAYQQEGTMQHSKQVVE
jgi:hypothetical protein